MTRIRRTALALLCPSLLLAGSALHAQQAPPAAAGTATVSRPKVETAILPVHSADVDEVAKLLEAFRTMLGGSIHPDAGLKAIAVSGPHEMVAACRAAVEKLDVPPPPARSLELTFSVLVASKTSSAERPVPAQLQGVVAQLGKLAAFKSVWLADVQAVRVKEGGHAEVGGTIPPPEPGLAQIPYSIFFNEADRIPSEQGARVRLRNLALQARVEVRGGKGSTFSDAELKTDVEFAEGQKAVLGTTGIMGTDDSLILVVSARDAE